MKKKMMRILFFSLLLSLILATMALADGGFWGGGDDKNIEWLTQETGLSVYEASYRYDIDFFTDHAVGLKDSTGKVVLPAQYAGIFYFGDCRMRLCGLDHHYHYGVMTTDQKVIIPFDADNISVTNGVGSNFIVDYYKPTGLSPSENVGCALYDWNGKVLIPKGKYIEIKYVNGLDVYMVKSTKGWGLYRLGVGEIVPCQYTEMYSVKDSDFVIENSMGDGIYRLDVGEILPCAYKIVLSLKNGYYAAQNKDNTWVLMGDDEWIDIPFQYDRILFYAEGCLGVSQRFNKDDESLCGVVDIAGNILIPIDYHRVSYSYDEKKKEGRIQVVWWGGQYVERGSFGGSPIYDKVYLGKFYTVKDLKPVKFADVGFDAYYAEAVNWAVEKGITDGTTATTFSPNNTCTTAQILTFLWRANGRPKASIANPFTNVEKGDYFYGAALWAYEKGMVSGSVFNGGTPCTRSSTVTYMWKAAGKPAAGTANFTDVPADAEYAQAVAWAVAKGVTNGTTATTFAPDNTCTRSQIVTFLHRDLAK